MIRPVLLVPDPRLKRVCAPIEDFNAVPELICDLEDTMRDSPGCVGIAAPQIGELVRMAIVDTSGHKKHGAHSQGRLVLINPTITAREGELLGREGCLSIPDFTANVRRARRVQIEYCREDGTPATLAAEEFEAVVIQHEIDHLDGLLFLDRVANLKTDVFPRRVRK